MSSEKNEECVAKDTECPFMALTDTKFSGNEAEVAGGAVFAGYLEAIRFDCSDASSDARLEFYEAKEWKALSRLESEKDICPSWRGNYGSVYGSDVGTYAAHAKMTFEKANRSVCVSGKDDCVIDGYRAGSDLPKAEVKLLDGLEQGPAISYRPIRANLSSVGGKFMVGSVIMSMEEGNCTFQSIRGSVCPGEYKLTVEFGEEAIENIGITVIVRNCLIGESVSSGGICVDCSSTTYNFLPSASGCQPCPENGNCTTQVITPNDGYWQKTPCSDQLYRCLPTSACKVEGRTERLTEAVNNVTNCSFDQSMIENYTQTQCAEVSCIASAYRLPRTPLFVLKRVTKARCVDRVQRDTGRDCRRSAKTVGEVSSVLPTLWCPRSSSWGSLASRFAAHSALCVEEASGLAKRAQLDLQKEPRRLLSWNKKWAKNAVVALFLTSCATGAIDWRSYCV